MYSLDASINLFASSSKKEGPIPILLPKNIASSANVLRYSAFLSRLNISPIEFLILASIVSLYFFLRKCVKETTEEPVQIDMPDEPGRKVS